MPSPCAKCKHYTSGLCTEPCKTYKEWRVNPEEFETKMNKSVEVLDKTPDSFNLAAATTLDKSEFKLPSGVFWVKLDLRRDNVCAGDFLDITRTITVRSDQKMSDIDDELRKNWLPTGYKWEGDYRSGTVRDYVLGTRKPPVDYTPHGTLNYRVISSKG